MDPQSQSFTPYSSNHDTWRMQADVTKLQQIQTEHTDRIARLERRQDEDARMRSVWGNSSPFPSVLSGTPQQAPLQQPPADHFRGFDDDTNNLMGSIHLDADDEPRRGLGAASRANSVRFDESANQNHFSHSSRPSIDIMSRTSSGLGGILMTERAGSHKSEGRASSAHSMRSAASGRASSLNLDVGYGLGDLHRPLLDPPGFAPGMLLLGAVPAIIRCWMNTNFKHEALLYAAVCTGSYKSYLDIRLIQKLGFEDGICTNADGERTVKLPVFFPEAVPHPTSSRPSSPAPQLPSVTVDFQVVEPPAADLDSKAIQIFLGSDTLRAHQADILFSSNSMTMVDDERSKLSIPLVRPENDASFKSLYVTSGVPRTESRIGRARVQAKDQLCPGQVSSEVSVSSMTTSPPPSKYPPSSTFVEESSTANSPNTDVTGGSADTRPVSRQSLGERPSLTLLNTRSMIPDPPPDSGSQTTPLRSDTSPAIWSNWRRDGPPSAAAVSQPSSLDWAKAGKNRETPYQRKDTGIKVLKPKTSGRAFSTSATSGPTGPVSAGEGKSRFFDDGRQRHGPDGLEAKAPGPKKENQAPPSNTGPALPAAPKTKTNPVGGASAFSWLNSGGGGGSK